MNPDELTKACRCCRRSLSNAPHDATRGRKCDPVGGLREFLSKDR